VTRILAALFLGLGVAGATWLAARGLFASSIFARRNVRGVEVPVGAGILAVLTVVAVQACFGVADVARDVVGDDSRGRILAVATGLGFGLVGIVDDLVGDHGDKGFGGHLRALGSGRLTTGGLKLLGGGLMSLGVGAYVADDVGELLVAASVIALGANTANLFDRAPGRVTKVALVAFAVLVVVTPGAERFGLVGVAALVGAVAGLFVFDLSEQLMLGDAGANPLGAVLGLGVVLTTGTVTQLVVLGVLVAVNVAGGPLRTLDQLGRRPL